MFVRDYMTPNPITINPDAVFPEAMNLLRPNKIRRLPVLDDGGLVGIVVEKDLLSYSPSPATSLSVYEMYYLLERLRVRQMMSHPVITVGGDCPLEEAARIMVERKIGSLPVMQGDRLVGIITETDIFRTLVEVLGGQELGTRITLHITERVGELAKVVTRIAQAGGNILAITTSRLLASSEREVMIKAAGAGPEKLSGLLPAGEGKVVDIRTSARYPVRLFGAEKKV
jgi:acetoin utilization protein AcuB